MTSSASQHTETRHDNSTALVAQPSADASVTTSSTSSVTTHSRKSCACAVRSSSRQRRLTGSSLCITPISCVGVVWLCCYGCGDSLCMCLICLQHLHPNKSCLSFLVSSFGRSFYLAYGIRAGISLALHIIKLLRSKNPAQVLSLDALVGAHGLPIDAVRMGLFIGGYSALYNGVRCALIRLFGHERPLHVFMSGLLAGVSLKFLPADSHRFLALALLSRVAQCWYNSRKQAYPPQWHIWGSSWPHGDSLLFAFCTAQVMYSYVMRPDTLPPSYWKFIVDTGPITPPILEATKLNARGMPLDLMALSKEVDARRPVGASKTLEILTSLSHRVFGPNAHPSYPPLLPCSILHPHNPSCHTQWMETFMNGAKRTFPLYASLTFVPMFVLRFWHVLRHPLSSITRGLLSSLYSTAFISFFVSSYMCIVCLHRRVATHEHKLLYWVAGFLSSWSILLEQKSRRSELALYVLPRTLDSFYLTAVSRGWIRPMRNGAIMTFAFSMACLMYYREYHPDSMSPLLSKLLNFFVPRLPKSLLDPHGHEANINAVATAATATSAVAATTTSAVSAAPLSAITLTALHPDTPGSTCQLTFSPIHAIHDIMPLPSTVPAHEQKNSEESREEKKEPTISSPPSASVRLPSPSVQASTPPATSMPPMATTSLPSPVAPSLPVTTTTTSTSTPAPYSTLTSASSSPSQPSVPVPSSFPPLAPPSPSISYAAVVSHSIEQHHELTPLRPPTPHSLSSTPPKASAPIPAAKATTGNTEATNHTASKGQQQQQQQHKKKNRKN